MEKLKLKLKVKLKVITYLDLRIMKRLFLPI